ncbi:ClpS-like protein [Gonapodya prolifera JEL478]|uniref:ClpS-like protein n=1 Tax=Gonapodya prolifera (strain JEL478) TaxID=1344416 RepID=A0A139ADN4_GONPJ|nr:ClpS-like protein [Gonapodya prolifera JEL478]|eukprot:KXS14868.1 ClpS-like protein [Gonapodya prolifera JEL478]
MSRHLSRRVQQAVCSRLFAPSSSLSTPLFAPVLSRRHNATSTSADVSPKVAGIVDQIASLTLLETADLVAALKTRLNITEVAMPVHAIPQLPTAASPAAGAAPAAAAPEPEEKAPEKTQFNVKLEKYKDDAKAKVIKEIKSLIPGLSLVDAKKFVESAPKVVKENLSKDEAEKIKKQLEAIGATVVLE